MSAGEIDIFPQLLIGETSGNLRRVFYLSDAVKKTSRGDSGIVNLHVVGAGVMGGDIAAFSALKGLNVSLADMNQRALENALERAQKLFERRLKTEEEISAAMTRLQIDATGESASKADLIIGSSFGKIGSKTNCFFNARKNMRTRYHLSDKHISYPP